MKYFIIKVIILILFYANSANALNYYSSIGVSTLYTKINDPNYDFVNEYEQLENHKQQIRSLTFGHTIEFDNKLSVNFTTNRLFNKDTSRAVRHKETGAVFLNKTKLTYDSFAIGKRIYKRYIPAIFIANAKIDKKLYKDNILLGNEVKHSLLYGFNLTAYLNKEISTSLFIIMPNSEFDLKYGFGVGFNFNF